MTNVDRRRILLSCSCYLSVHIEPRQTPSRYLNIKSQSNVLDPKYVYRKYLTWDDLKELHRQFEVVCIAFRMINSDVKHAPHLEFCAQGRKERRTMYEHTSRSVLAVPEEVNGEI
jgi:hypothetical protein